MNVKRLGTITIGVAILSVIAWQAVFAGAGSVSHPAQQQLLSDAVISQIRASDAEHVSAAYIPGMGAVISIDLLRGANAVPNQPSWVGTRDWAVYLMQTFGGKLTAVPPDESIAISVDFYDYQQSVYHQIVVRTRANDASDPAKYTVFLDGKPYAEATRNDAPTAAPSATPSANTTAKATATAAPKGPTAAPVADVRPITLPYDLTDGNAVSADWSVVGGMWAFTGGNYEQTELGRFDLVSILRQRVQGSVLLQAVMTYREGDMGGGIVFNAPAPDSKNGAQMVSYTAKGTYLQWGYYDANGDFQFQGGANVPPGQDGKAHQIIVHVTGATYSVMLDGAELTRDVRLTRPMDGYVGLLASTSRVVFNTVHFERG